MVLISLFVEMSYADEFVDLENLIRFSEKWLDETGAQGDLNMDYSVDANDLDLIFDNWLLTDAVDPNDPNSVTVLVDMGDFAKVARSWRQRVSPISMDFNYDGIVNLQDFTILAMMWQDFEIGLDVIDLATNNYLSLDNVYGEVTLLLDNIPLWADVVEVHIDDIPISKWNRYDKSYNREISLDTTLFLNGQHEIHLVPKIDYYGINFPNTYFVSFNNLVHSVNAKEILDPNEPYSFSGIYDGDKTLGAKIVDWNGQVMWSDTYSGPEINISVPYQVFDSKDVSELVITEDSNSIPVASFGMIQLANGQTPGEMHKDIVKAFNPNDNFQMLIVLPYRGIYGLRQPAIYECIRACENRNVSWRAIYGTQVTAENLTIALPKAKYIYWTGHGFNYVGQDLDNGIQGVGRTYQSIWEDTDGGLWDLFDNWDEIPALSWTHQTAPGAEPLPNNWDERGFDVSSLGMYESWKKKIVLVDACMSAYFEDMAFAYGMYSLQGQGSKDQIYIGWRRSVHMANTPYEIFMGDTTEALRIFWEKLGNGGSVKYALERTRVEGTGAMQYALWGDNRDIDLGDVDGDDFIFTWGQGFVNLHTIKLGWD